MQVTIVFGLFSWSCGTTSHLLVRFWRVWLIQAGEKLVSYLALWLSDLHQVSSLSISHTKHSLVRLANDLANINHALVGAGYLLVLSQDDPVVARVVHHDKEVALLNHPHYY